MRIRGAASLPVRTTRRPCFANVRSRTPRLRSSSAARVRHARERHVRRCVRLTSERHLLHVKYRQRQTWTWRWILGRRRRGSGPTRREVPQNPACRRGLSAVRHANSGCVKLFAQLGWRRKPPRCRSGLDHNINNKSLIFPASPVRDRFVERPLHPRVPDTPQIISFQATLSSGNGIASLRSLFDSKD